MVWIDLEMTGEAPLLVPKPVFTKKVSAAAMAIRQGALCNTLQMQFRLPPAALAHTDFVLQYMEK